MSETRKARLDAIRERVEAQWYDGRTSRVRAARADITYLLAEAERLEADNVQWRNVWKQAQRRTA